MSEFDEDEEGEYDPEYGIFPVPATPHDGVVGTSPGERALGRFFRIELPVKPVGESQSDLAGDTFFSLYKNDPFLIENTSPSRSINKKLIEWAMKSPEWDTSSSRSNLPASLSAASLLWSHLTSSDALKESVEKQKEAEQKEKEAQDLLESATDAYQEGDDAAGQEYQEAAQEAMAEAQAIAQSAVEQIEQLQENPLGKGMMNTAVQEANEEAEKVGEFMQGWGIGSGDVNMIEAHDIIQYANGELDEISDLIGRMQGIAAKAIEHVKNTFTGVVTEPAMTKDIEHLFPSELAKLSIHAPKPIRAQAFYQLFFGGGMLGWRPKVEGKRAGAAVFYLDRSGSMYGDPLNAGKGICLGLAKAITSDKDLSTRYYEMHYFDDGVPDVTCSSKDDWRAHLEWAGLECSGGTDFDKAIAHAIRRLRALKEEGIDGADLVFITDECAPISPATLEAWKKLKSEFDTRMLTVSINTWGGFANPTLEEMSDVLIKVGKPSNLGSLAEEIVNRFTTEIVKNDLERR